MVDNNSVTPIGAQSPVPDFSVLELATMIVFVRYLGLPLGDVAAELSRWLNVEVEVSALTPCIRRLLHREWMTGDDANPVAAPGAAERAEFSVKGLLRLVFRGRYFFDVTRLLDMTSIEEEKHRER